MDDHGLDVHWSWPEAEARMRAAFIEGGLSRWIQVAMSELEREASMERLKRRVDKSSDGRPDKTSS